MTDTQRTITVDEFDTMPADLKPDTPKQPNLCMTPKRFKERLRTVLLLQVGLSIIGLMTSSTAFIRNSDIYDEQLARCNGSKGQDVLQTLSSELNISPDYICTYNADHHASLMLAFAILVAASSVLCMTCICFAMFGETNDNGVKNPISTLIRWLSGAPGMAILVIGWMAYSFANFMTKSALFVPGMQ